MAILSLLMGVAVAVAGSLAADPVPDLQVREPIRVNSTSYEIDFPNEVVFRLEAEADFEITEVTLLYRLGGKRIRILGYPSFTSSTRVTADFRVKTGGASYLPSGVDIEYYYVIQDSQGNAFESERLYLEYKDPAYTWQRVQRGDLIILWHDRPRDGVVKVAEEVSQRLDPVKSLLGLETPKPMKAVILNSRREAGRSFPFVSGAATEGHVYGGFAFGDLDVFVLVGLSGDGMVHEMTHLLVDEALYSPLARVPAWLNEGLAMYFESGSRGREVAVSRALREDRLLPLRSMGNIPGRPRDIGIFYAQSLSVVRHLMDAHGQERMAALLMAINEGKGVEEAVREVYGTSLEELEQEWKSQLAEEPSVAPVVDPGTAGTTLIIVGAIVVASTVVSVRWLRRILKSPGSESGR